MKYQLITYLFVYVIVCFGCKRNSANEIVISNNIDTSELIYERIFPAAYYDRLENNIAPFIPGYKKQKRKIGDEDRNNMAMVYLYERERLVKNNDTVFANNKYFSAYCRATFFDDTLSIAITTEPFNNKEYGVVIKIGNCYSSYYYENMDYLEPSGGKKAKAIEQKLVLDKKPILKWGRVLTGEFEGVFEPISRGNKADTIGKRVKIVFKGAETAILRM